MKNKIVGICICMLLIATAVPAVISVKNSAINVTIPRIAQASMSGTWIQQQKLLASDGVAGNNFGNAFSIDGDTALIGAQGWIIGNGSAYVFTRTGTTWIEQQKLVASDGAEDDNFGIYVSLDGDTALIGAFQDDDNGVNSGSAYVFTRTGTTWTQQQKLTAPDGTANDWFGLSISLDGDTALIGAQGDPTAGDTGSAYVFTRTGTTWTLQQQLFASDAAAGDCFGFMVSLEGDTALIGADYDDDNGNNSGSAYVFTRTGTTWAQQAKLTASDGAAGDDFSGGGVFLSGDTALIGAELDDDKGDDSGSAYVFTRSGTTWTQQAKLLASDGAAGDQFSCWAVCLDGDTALIGAWQDDDNGVNSGSAYMFTRTGTTWTQQQKLLASDGAAVDMFGVGVALNGSTAFIGAWYDDDKGANSGSAYMFTKQDIPSVDVPMWEIGDSWTYNIRSNEYSYTQNGTLWGVWYNNCTATIEVIDDTGDNYTMKMTSKNIEGMITLGSFRLKFTPFTKFTWDMIFRKTDLADCSQFFQEKGLVFWLIGNIGIPIPAAYKRTWGSVYTPGAIILPFPLTAGTQGTLPGYSYTYEETCSLYWLIKLINNPVDSFTATQQQYHCEMANITVPAGTYDAYNISVDLQYGAGHSHSWRYYVPEVGFFGKQYADIDNDNSGKPYAHYEWELISTTYTQ